MIKERRSGPARALLQYRAQRKRRNPKSSKQGISQPINFSCEFQGCSEYFAQRDQLDGHREIHRNKTEQPVLTSAFVEDLALPKQRMPSSDCLMVVAGPGDKQKPEAFVKVSEMADVTHDIVEHAGKIVYILFDNEKPSLTWILTA